MIFEPIPKLFKSAYKELQYCILDVPLLLRFPNATKIGNALFLVNVRSKEHRLSSIVFFFEKISPTGDFVYFLYKNTMLVGTIEYYSNSAFE